MGGSDASAPRCARDGALRSGVPLSMYTELLHAALDGLPASPTPEDRELFFAEVLQRRRELALDLPPDLEASEAVPVVLARQVGYDVALIRLACCMGVEADPGRFGPAGHERARLEEALRDLGLGVGPAARTEFDDTP